MLKISFEELTYGMISPCMYSCHTRGAAVCSCMCGGRVFGNTYITFSTTKFVGKLMPAANCMRQFISVAPNAHHATAVYYVFVLRFSADDYTATKCNSENLHDNRIKPPRHMSRKHATSRPHR